MAEKTTTIKARFIWGGIVDWPDRDSYSSFAILSTSGYFSQIQHFFKSLKACNRPNYKVAWSYTLYT
jgi:hypothetical protein